MATLKQENLEKQKLKQFEALNQSDEPNLPIFGLRHVQFILLFFGATLAFAMRANLSVGIVAMTEKNQTNSDYETFDWDPNTKQMILGSIFWGYIFVQIPGSIICKRYGAKYVLGISTFFTSVFTLATPILTSLCDWQGLLVLRILIGICQGFLYSSCETFKAKWAPPLERGSLTVFTNSGVMFGIFLTLATSGKIAVSLGWAYIFYIQGALGLLWTVCWLMFSADTPAQHGQISEAEKKYILDSLGHSADSHKEYIPTPWLKILTSIPFYALLLTFCADSWALLISYTESPIYVNAVFGISLSSNGLLSSLPYLAHFIIVYLLIGIDSTIVKKQLMTIPFSRKFFTFIGLFTPALCLSIFSFIPNDNIGFAITMLVIASATNAALNLGSYVAVVDMAPNHAGILAGILCTVCGVTMNFAPVLVGMIVTDEDNQSQWQIIFVATAIVLVIGCIGFLLFGSNEVQDWNDVPRKKRKVKYSEKLFNLELRKIVV